MGGKKKYINIFGSFTEPFNYSNCYQGCKQDQILKTETNTRPRPPAIFQVDLG